MSKGPKVRSWEIRAYETLRREGMSPEAAAGAIKRSKSWAYEHEKKKRQPQPRNRPEAPNKNLSDAVEMVVAIKRAFFYEREATHSKPEEATRLRQLSEREDEKAFGIADRFQGGIIPYLADLAYFLANDRAGLLQEDLLRLFDGEPQEAELRKEPVTPEEILYNIPRLMDRHHVGKDVSKRWEPPRLRQMLDRFMDENPDLEQIDKDSEAAKLSDDPEAAFRLIDERIENGYYDSFAKSPADPEPPVVNLRERIDAGTKGSET